MEHKESGYNNTAFIEVLAADLDIVIKAETEVNSLIARGHSNDIHISSWRSKAPEIPNLRANEERISATTPSEVKVVEIENHDISACSMAHANNLQNVIFF